MKKLSLDTLRLNFKYKLQPEQLKNVLGGDYNEGGFKCYSNGHPVGNAENAAGCAAFVWHVINIK
ncbi:hypothetical protein MQE36_12165 [Zhouia spongiae]|uniref:Bacteriocin n=1 Tax=Zhouia spongiae TaxID=2202721 RepID=A0ABY3YJR3_9FLAO|nr:hypothetical protein [Zhouia spongiae]UNY97839.1 hypothetical protein MQE36_12165 [Zhouia spongiae]